MVSGCECGGDKSPNSQKWRGGYLGRDGMVVEEGAADLLSGWFLKMV